MARYILLAFVLGTSLLGGCGSDGDSSQTPNAPVPPANNPVPAITSLSPSSAGVGGGTFTLTVHGTSFQQNSTVYWAGSARPTTYLSANQLSATIAGADLASISPIQVTVWTPGPGGGTSAAQVFQVVRVAPILSSISPSSTTAGSAPVRLTVEGSNFDYSATIRWNGSDRATTVVSSTQLTTTLSSADVATANSGQVTVSAPAPGGGTSSAATFTVLPAIPSPVPTIASLSPASFTAGVTGLAVAVTGTGFVGGSIAQWNGANRATIVKSSTQLFVAPLPGDIAATGTALITVINPAPGGGMSGSLVATMSAIPAGAIGVTDRLSVAADFAEALGASGAEGISDGGRFIAFTSNAGNLVPGDTNGASDVFIRDTCRGASSACTPSVTRVSVANNGDQGDGPSSTSAVSADGRFVAFVSRAANLAPGDVNATDDVFLRDTCAGATGCVPSTTLVSASDSGVPGANYSGHPALSADGRFVSFESLAGNLISGDTNASMDVFRRDTCAGANACSPSTIRVSVANDGSQATGSTAPESYQPAMSADGRFVAFTSRATNLVASDTNGFTDIFVRDTCVGVASCTPATARVSLDSTDNEANAESFLPGMSVDGRFVVFTSWATDMVPGDTNGHDVFVRDTCRGAAAACTPSNRRVSVGSSGAQANQNSGGPATGGATISGDGRFVAFGSRATNLVGGDSIGQFEIFLYDTCEGAIGCVPSTKRLSAALDGTQSLENERSDAPVISADGRFVAFSSNSAAFLPGDTNGTTDVFLARTGAP